jgi:16S rRNA (guanine527-N7)-methyltransferase
MSNQIHASRELFMQEMRHASVDVSRETRDRLETYVHLLMRWQKIINLVSNATLDEIWIRHVLDSAQLAVLVPRSIRKLTDMGSGAGFPGLVIAAFRPELEVTLIESDARKAAFLGEAGRRMELAIQPKVVVGRIEAVPPTQAEIVTARALAPLTKLLDYAERHRAANAICLFHKGKDWQAELTVARQDWDIQGQPFTSVTEIDAVIYRITDYKRLESPGAAPAAAANLRDRKPKGRRRKDDDGD